MAIRNAYVMEFMPIGLSDATEEDGAFPGACTILKNLIPDPRNSTRVVSRPGVGSSLTNFASFTNPGFISTHIVVGTKVYGMVSTTRLGAYDEPFVFDIATGLFTAVTGTSTSNLPLTQPSSGAWEPPTTAVVGNYLVVTHPGYGSNIRFGLLNLTTFAWTAQNTTTNLLPARPTAVANFNNRAWFAVNNQAWYTNPLDPTKMSNANQALTLGDNTNITAMAGLPVATSSAGILQTLVIFKGSQVWQISGDSSTSNLAQNYMHLSVGTTAPRSVSTTPRGLVFLGPDGHYIIPPSGVIEPLAYPGQPYQDVRQPFQNALYPTRIASASNGQCYRISLETYVGGVLTTNDYWFDLKRMRWSGPHTFNYDCASPYGYGFILSNAALGANLFYSSALPTQYGVSAMDNGATIAFEMGTVLLSSPERMSVKQAIEVTDEHSSKGVELITVDALNIDGSMLSTATLSSGVAGGAWGQSGLAWGQSGLAWDAWLGSPEIDIVPWTVPLVFKRLSFRRTTQNGVPVQFGPIRMRVQDTGYTNNKT